MYLYVSLCIYVCMYHCVYVSMSLSIHLLIHSFIYPSLYLYLSLSLSVSLCLSLSVSIYPSIYLFFLCLYPSTCVSFYPSSHLSICLSVCLFVCLSICVFFLILRIHRSILVSTPFSTRVFEGSPKKHFGVDCFYTVQSSSLRMWSTQRKTQGGKAKSRDCGGRREFVGGVVDRWNKLLQRGGSPSKAVSHVLSCMTGNLKNFTLCIYQRGVCTGYLLELGNLDLHTFKQIQSWRPLSN